MTHPLSHTPQSLCETGSECGVQLCGAVQASVVNGYPMHSVTGAKELLRVYTSFQATMRTTVRRVFVNQVSSAHAQHGAARLWAHVRSGRVYWPGSVRGACVWHHTRVSLCRLSAHNHTPVVLPHAFTGAETYGRGTGEATCAEGGDGGPTNRDARLRRVHAACGGAASGRQARAQGER